MKTIDKAKRELDDFNGLIKKVWNEDFTDKTELLCLQFYKAGIKFNETYTAELEKKLEIAVEALERIKLAKTIPKNGKIKYWSLDACRNFARIALNKLKGESK